MICNDYCRLCLNSNNVVNIFCKELINSESDKLRNYIFICSGVNILSEDVITKCVCHPCLETIRKIMKFRKSSINNDLKLKSIFHEENNIKEEKINNIDDVFHFLSPLEEPKIKNKYVNMLKYNFNVDNVHLDLTKNKTSELNTPINVSFDSGGVEMFESEEQKEKTNTNEFDDLIIKEETVVTAVGLSEEVELRKNEEVLKREYISDDEDCLNELNLINFELILNEKEEENKLTNTENDLNKSNNITKEVVIVLEDYLLSKNELKIQTVNNMNENVNRNKIYSNSDEKSHVKKRKFVNSGKKKTYKCPECGKQLRTSLGLKIHRRMHSGEKPYECTVCGKRFRQNSHLKEHRYIHSDQKSYKCLKCGKCFQQPSGLRHHQRIHSEKKPHKCSECGKHFRRLSYLNSHRLIHSGEKPYECFECGKRFNKVGHLKSHQLVHSGEKPFKCLECGKCFRQSSGLRSHRLVHSGEKRYECPKCKNQFSRKDTLIRHMIIHSGEKLYECSECGKRFHYKNRLVLHLSIHSSEKPFECSQCGKKFRLKKFLNSHMSVHSGRHMSVPSVENATSNSII